MAKITLDSVISGFKSVTRLVSNFSKIEDSLNNDVLWRDNPEGEPNQMEDDLDMNTNRITNLPSPVNDTDAVRWVDVKDGVTGVNEVVPSQSGNEKVALTTNGTSLVFGAVDSDNVDFLQAGTGAVATDVQSKLRETVSVKDFGAVGDGVTDDTAAVQAALNTGELVVFNKGVYVFSDTLTITKSVVGKEAVLLPQSFSLSATTLLDAGGVTDVEVEGLELDLSFFTAVNDTAYSSLVKCVNMTNTTNATLLSSKFTADSGFNWERFIDINSSHKCTIKHCTFTDVTGEVIAAIGYTTQVEGNRIIGVKRDNGAGANRAIIAGGSEELHIINNYIEDTEFVTNKFDSVAAIDIGAANNVIVTGNILKNVAVGLDFEAASLNSSDKIVISNNVVEGRTGGGTYVGNGIWGNFASQAANDVTISNNVISKFEEPLQCTTAYNISITGNVITGDNHGINLQGAYKYAVTGNVITMTSGLSAILAVATNDTFAGGVISSNTMTVATTNAMYVDAEGGLSGSDRLPREWVNIYGNSIIDSRVFASRSAVSVLKGRIKEWGNTYNFTDFVESATPSVRTGDTYRLFASSPVTFTDFVDDKCLDREINILCRSSNITFDFSNTSTVSKLKGNSGVDITPTAGSLVLCRKVDDGFGATSWLCAVREA